jgi:hypothetical protein
MLDAVDDLTLLPGDVELKLTLRGDTCAKRKARQLSLLPGTACVVWLPSFLKAGISSVCCLLCGAGARHLLLVLQRAM